MKPRKLELGIRRESLDKLAEKPVSSIPESTLIHGYRSTPKRPRRIAQEPVGRPLATAFDDSGLWHGEPVSEGRSARNGD